MKNLRKKPVKILFFAIFFTIYNLHSQSSNQASVYNWFDNTVKKENLPINNGKLHTNFDKLLGKVDRYYISDKFSHGNLGYENQEYFDTDLKYDIYKDELILKSEGDGLIEINLIKENVQYFKLYDRKFVNLNSDKLLPANLRSGYYEENQVGKNFIFYIKHYKDKKEIIKGTENFIDYYYKNQFVLFINGKYNLVNSKSELIKLFPNEKNKINDFYLLNRNLKSENEPRFMENLMRYINSI
nr:hypothetical protein [uncultured Flavobacterium sp.]